MKVKIDLLDINLFKGFKKTRIVFSPGLNLLVGGNNSGKSSILHALYLSFYFLKLTDGISQINKKNGKLSGIAVRSIPLPFHEDSYISEGLKKRTSGNVTQIGITTRNKINFVETMTFPGSNLLIRSSDAKGRTGNKAYQKNIKRIVVDKDCLPLFIPTFSGVANKEEIKMAAVVKHYLSTGKSSEVLRNQLEVISKNKNKLNKLNSYLKKSFGVEIVSNDTKEIYLSSLYKENEYDNLDISSAGSGFQQILQILVYVVSSSSDIILIDEPDAHLHYKLQNNLYEILSEMASEGKQIIVATHSQIFIKKAIQNADRLILVNKKLAEQKSFDEYAEGLQLMYEEGIIDENELTQGGSLKLIDIEDSKGGAGFNVIKEFLLKMGIREPEYRIVSAGDHIFGYINARGNIDNISLKALILRDSDSLQNEHLKVIESKQGKANRMVRYWRYHEIENYLLRADIILRVMKNRGIKNITISDVKNMISDVVMENKDQLFDHLENVLHEKFKKHFREIGLEFGNLHTDVSERKIKIRDEFMVYPFQFLPGKQVFNLLKGDINKRYKVLISEIEIAKAFNIKDLPSEIMDAVKFIQG